MGVKRGSDREARQQTSVGRIPVKTPAQARQSRSRQTSLSTKPRSGYTRSANLCGETNPSELHFQPTSHPVKSPWGLEPVLRIILECIVCTRDIKNQFTREGLEAMS